MGQILNADGKPLNPGIIIPGDPDLVGIIEIRYWKNGLIRVSRPHDKELVRKMMTEAQKVIDNKTHSEGSVVLNLMPDLQEALKK